MDNLIILEDRVEEKILDYYSDRDEFYSYYDDDPEDEFIEEV